MTVNVLGASYTLKFIPEEEDEGLKDCDGYCDETIKTLVVKQYKCGEPGSKKPLTCKRKKNFRHEIIHAFLYEKRSCRKTPHGRRKKKWWTGLPSSFRSCWLPFGRWMPCEEPPPQSAARVLQALQRPRGNFR